MTRTERTPEVVLDTRARLGEGPVWDERTQSLYFVDVLNHRLHQYFPDRGTARTFEVGDMIGCVAFTRGDELILGLKKSIASLDTTTGAITCLLPLEEDRPKNKLNDGKCDSAGRLWIGSFSREEGKAAHYRYDPDGSLHVMQEGMTGSNGLGWSPDESLFYLTDSGEKQIFVYDFRADTGEISNRRVFADLSDREHTPDGLAVDADGFVWSAQFDGGYVIRLDADGRETDRLELPVPRTTSCAFGGPEGDDLYVTTAAVGLSEEEIEQGFHAGDLFRVELGIPGLPFHPFGG
jgi:sugar lactone lactonase YvrE